MNRRVNSANVKLEQKNDQCFVKLKTGGNMCCVLGNSGGMCVTPCAKTPPVPYTAIMCDLFVLFVMYTAKTCLKKKTYPSKQQCSCIYLRTPSVCQL